MTREKKDYFVACLKDGSLAMRPFCGICGIQLNEDYYCEDCKRQCLCTHIKCEDKESYDLTNALVKNNERFKSFTVEILLGPSES